MVNVEYFVISILAGALTSLVCAMKKMVTDDESQQDNFPDSEKVDNKITLKRLIWMFGWIFQGVIGGLIVAFLFVEPVRNGTFQAGWVFALSFASGSVSWTNPKKSFAAIKNIIGFGNGKNED
ncbi:hypothetical protein [Marinobacter sp.]|uniref:hypothetical protein n=1 Tax=Marinobacter sp. TaxID=50741 RepID=UPI003A91E345